MYLYICFYLYSEYFFLHFIAGQMGQTMGAYGGGMCLVDAPTVSR